MKKALFIGRFQPFHLGHLSVIKEIAKQPNIDEIIIGIAGPKNEINCENPYSFAERKKMINIILKDEINKPYLLVVIPDINNDDLWVDYLTKMVGESDVIYTGNNWVSGLFQKKNYKVIHVNYVINISGTKLRKLIKNNDVNWKKYVSPKIISLIKNE